MVDETGKTTQPGWDRTKGILLATTILFGIIAVVEGLVFSVSHTTRST